MCSSQCGLGFVGWGLWVGVCGLEFVGWGLWLGFVVGNLEFHVKGFWSFVWGLEFEVCGGGAEQIAADSVCVVPVIVP